MQNRCRRPEHDEYGFHKFTAQVNEKKSRAKGLCDAESLLNDAKKNRMPENIPCSGPGKRVLIPSGRIVQL